MTNPNRESWLRYTLRVLTIGIAVGILMFIAHVLIELI